MAKPMAMASLLAAISTAVILLCCSPLPTSANDGCTDAITGYSATFGARNTAKLDRFNNQVAQWTAKGAIAKLQGYYNSTAKCVQGLEMTYGYNSVDARLLGMESGFSSKDMTLVAYEDINKIQVRANTCVEFIRMVTTNGRAFAIGNNASTSALVTVYPNKKGGFLAAIRGYEEYTKATDTTTTRGPMRTLQLVWGYCTPSSAAVPLPSPSPSPSLYPALTPAPSCPTLSSIWLMMCAANATEASSAYCPIVAPFTKAACVGGCCFSAGRCTSSSCAIAGMGTEVQNTICSGLNPAGAVGSSASCAGLACKLAIPGCNSDLTGGSCVGRVVDINGTVNATNPAGAKYIGYPCLDVTPSDITLTAAGVASTSGSYMAKVWSICDCYYSAATTASTPSTTSTSVTVPLASQLNITDIFTLVEAVLPGSSSNATFKTILGTVASDISSFVVPDLHTPNLTTTLSFLGSLVGKSAATSAETTPINAMINLVKGASAVATAMKSDNPLGALLGAFTTSSNRSTANPLAGLANLVSALAPQNADTTEKSDILSKILNVLSGGTSAAPTTNLISAVANILGGGGNDSPAAGLTAVLSKFKVPTDTADLIADFKAAVSVAKKAASLKSDVTAVLSKLKSWLTGSSAASTTGGTTSSIGSGSSSTLPNLVSLISAIQSLMGSSQSGASAGSSNMLSALSSLVGGANSSTANLQTVVNLATRANPVLQQLAAVSNNTLIKSLLSTATNGQVTSADIANLARVSSQVTPLLQALGGTTASSTSSTSGLSGVLSTLGKLGLGGTSAGSSSVGINDITNLINTTTKVAPILEALSSATKGTTSSSFLTGLQSFLGTLSS